ncbi:MAG: bifunctional riboflavin kinase/FAD synthetase [Prevotella sp.]|nr:bifunctional riboflavin kinase/FAD synthetase [Prevotella sp.]
MNKPNNDLTGCVATIGFFDGVHRGHQFVVGCVSEMARERGLESVVVTFDHHPREVLSPKAEDAPSMLLTTLTQKRQLILAVGADRCEVLHFDKSLASLSAREFMEKVLLQQLNVKVLLTGYDNHFGRRNAQSTEGFSDYVAYGQELGIEVIRLPEFPESEVSISSSMIRRALREGNLALANDCLGRPYSITGCVVHGHAEGRKLGFPTANLSPESVKELIPAPGVYAVKATIGSATDALPAMLNIGSRPTFKGNNQTIEAHIFDFDGDLYGQEISISFIERIREEQPFQSPEALRQQLEKDKKTVSKVTK